MSYANGTTHYNLPQTVGTDKRDWFDTNQAFADIDETLYGAVQQSASTAAAITALTTRVGEAESDIATIQASQSTDEANIAALQTLVNQHTSEIADVKADALDMICAIDEGTAQVATVAVTEGKYFRYNDVLYMATTNIAVGDTIVPNTNCRATNVATELESITGGDTPLSHVGQIIFSTTLDTEAKVIAQYGGTTWTQIEGRFILGASTDYTVESTGGEATHTLTTDEMPNHRHNVNVYHYQAGANLATPSAGNGMESASIDTTAVGGGQAHNNMPPYFTTYIWHRTA